MRIAAQMYTLRDFTGTAEAFEDALRMLHGIGYEGVQLSAVGCMNGECPELDAAAAREMLNRHGLLCCATHRPWRSLLEDTSSEIAFHHALGCDYTAIGGLWGEYDDTVDEYRRFVRDAEPMIATLKQAGIRFGYHNHSHEFVRDPSGLHPAYDVLLSEGGPDLKLEVDTYWVAHAGISPASLLRRATGRIEVVHLKDREVVPKEGPVMAPVGEGLLDWDEILAACREGGTEWLVVEQDVCRRDPFDCLASSFDFLSSRLS